MSDCQISEKKINRNFQICNYAKLMILLLYLVYSQIWLNVFLWTISTSATYITKLEMKRKGKKRKKEW